jgi:hypothetical protein
VPKGAKKSQKEPKGAKRFQKEPKEAKRSQKEPKGAKRSPKVATSGSPNIGPFKRSQKLQKVVKCGFLNLDSIFKLSKVQKNLPHVVF